MMEKNGSLMIGFQQLNTEKRKYASHTVLMTVLAAVYALAVTAGLPAVFETGFAYAPVAITCAIYSVLLNLMWDNGKSAGFKAAAGIIPLAAAIAAGGWIRNGIALIGNNVLTVIGAEQYRIYMPFSVTCSEPEFGTCITVTCCAAAAWITLLCVHLMRDNNRPAAMMLMAIMLVLNVLYGNTSSWGWLIASVICMTAVLTKAYLEEKLKGSRYRTVTADGILTAVCIMLLITGIMFAVVKPADYERPQMFAELTDKISEKIYSARYGDIEKQVLPSGDFNELGDLKMSGEVMMEITADEHESLYLRGFVGSEYTGDGWTEVDGGDLYDYADESYWIHRDGMYGQNQIASAAQVLDEKAAEKTLTMSVETKGADRHFYYTPYELTGLTDSGEQIMTETMLSDSSITSGGWSGQKKYEITTLENQVKRYPALVSQLKENYSSGSMEQYVINESQYNALVYDIYTELPDEMTKLMENQLKPYSATLQQGEKHLNYTLAKQIIQDYLNKNVTYSEEIARRGEDADFVTDFMEISKSGYSVHYATTAALMFRYYGIPARYVEGYLITPEKVRSAKAGSTVSITGKDAHAWVEYYQDGIGWIPFEVTPPYMDVMEQPEMTTAVGAGGVSGQGSGAAMEMAQDNYEPEEPEKAEEEKSVPWNRIFAGAGLLILAVLAALITAHLVRRKKKLNELERSFEMDDRDASVINMYVYILALQELLGVQSDPQIYSIYQRAAFSADQVSPDDRSLVADCKDNLLQRIVKECKLRKRFVYRWIKGIY